VKKRTRRGKFKWPTNVSILPQLSGGRLKKEKNPAFERRRGEKKKVIGRDTRIGSAKGEPGKPTRGETVLRLSKGEKDRGSDKRRSFGDRGDDSAKGKSQDKPNNPEKK